MRKSGFDYSDRVPFFRPEGSGVGKTDLFVSCGENPERSFQQWREPAFPGTASLLEVKADPRAFRTERARTQFDRMSITSAAINAMRYSRSAAQTRKDGVDGFWIELLVAGEGVTEANGAIRRQRPGDIHVNDLSKPIRRWTEANTYLAMYVSRDLAEGSELAAFQDRPPAPRRQQLLATYVKTVARQANAIADQTRLERATRAVLAVCTQGPRDTIDDGRPELDAVIDQSITRFIDKNLHRERLGVQAVAAASGVSRSTLYRLYDGRGGVEEHIWSRRLYRAWAEVSDPTDHRLLVEISESLGFKDASHFSRRFKEKFGVRPSDLR